MIASSLGSVANLKDTLNTRMDKKADVVFVERIVSKMRGLIANVRGVNTQTMRSVMVCMQMDKAERLIQQMFAQNGRAARQRTRENAADVSCAVARG